jgi:hypothetical protein
MMRASPAHKQMNPNKYPGQIVNATPMIQFWTYRLENGTRVLVEGDMDPSRHDVMVGFGTVPAKEVVR